MTMVTTTMTRKMTIITRTMMMVIMTMIMVLMIMHVKIKKPSCVQVVELVAMKCSQLEESRQQRVTFLDLVAKQQEWLASRSKSVDKMGTVRLLASDVDRQAEECKVRVHYAICDQNCV
jgi:hypothetical protein